MSRRLAVRLVVSGCRSHRLRSMKKEARRTVRSAELEIGAPNAKSLVWIGPSREIPSLEWHIAPDAAATDRHYDRGDGSRSVERGDARTRVAAGVEARRPGPRFHTDGIRRTNLSSEGSGGATGGDRVVSEGVHRWMNGRMPVARCERRRIAKTGGSNVCGERRFGRHESAIREIARAAISGFERSDEGNGAGIRRACAKRVRIAVDVLYRCGRPHRRHRQEGERLVSRA